METAEVVTGSEGGELASGEKTVAASTSQSLDLAAISQTGLFFLAAIYTLYLAKQVLLPIVLAFLISFSLAPVVRALNKIRIPSLVAAALVVLTLFGIVATGIYQFAEPTAHWLERAPIELRKLGTALENLRGPVERVTKAAEQAEELAEVQGQAQTVEVTIKKPALGEILLSTTQELLLGSILVLVLLFLLLASGDLFLKKIVHVMPRLREKRAVVAVARDVERHISAYLFGFTLNNAILGCAVTAALYYLGMPNPALWGILAALFNFIPYAGAVVTAAILTLASLTTFNDVSKTVSIVGTFMVLTTLEGFLMQPLILGRRLSLNPVAILVSVLIWGWLWGIPGALLAVPMLAVAKIVADAVEPFRPIGELLGN